MGEHPRLLNPGDFQTFQFGEGDVGPFYLTESERRQKRDDQPTGRLLKKKKKKEELSKELLDGGFVQERHLPTNLKDLQAKAQQHQIDIYRFCPEIVEGWLGKPKGLRQIAWERGLIGANETCTKAQLVEMLDSCTDFANAESNLQRIARLCGAKAERSPKFHCELAGEGIEYDWAFCKAKYRCRPLAEKRSRASFQTLVRELTSHDGVPVAKTKRSSARARSYISGYYNIHYNNRSLLREETTASALTDLDVVPSEPWKPAPGEVISMDLIEKIKKQYHSHRGVNCFEKGTVVKVESRSDES